ncbi:hypothetical protein TNCT_557611, partial [Trichonephila clavata]
MAEGNTFPKDEIFRFGTCRNRFEALSSDHDSTGEDSSSEEQGMAFEKYFILVLIEIQKELKG